MDRKRESGKAGVASDPRRVDPENNATSSGCTMSLGGQMEADADNRRQQGLNDYVIATFRWRQAIDKAATGDTSGIIKLFHAGNSIPPEVQSLLADVLKRYQLKKK